MGIYPGLEPGSPVIKARETDQLSQPGPDEKLTRECNRYIQNILSERAWFAQQIFERLLTNSTDLFNTFYTDTQLGSNTKNITSKEDPGVIITSSKQENIKEKETWTKVYSKYKRKCVHSKKESQLQKESTTKVHDFNPFGVLYEPEVEDDKFYKCDQLHLKTPSISGFCSEQSTKPSSFQPLTSHQGAHHQNTCAQFKPRSRSDLSLLSTKDGHEDNDSTKQETDRIQVPKPSCKSMPLNSVNLHSAAEPSLLSRDTASLPSNSSFIVTTSPNREYVSALPQLRCSSNVPRRQTEENQRVHLPKSVFILTITSTHRLPLHLLNFLRKYLMKTKYKFVFSQTVRQIIHIFLYIESFHSPPIRNLLIRHRITKIRSLRNHHIHT